MLIAQVNRRKKLPESAYRDIVAKQYKKRIGKDLDWDNIKSYTEKMQLEKLYNNYPLKSLCADKYLVREWVASKIGEDYLIPIISVWDHFEDIDFDLLPNKFVLKTNHGSGTNAIIKDKAKINKNQLRISFKDWMNTDFGYKSMELHYSKIVPKIIAEEFIETEDEDLQDYKFLCFDGVPKFCWVDKGRYSIHTRDVFDMDWKLQPWTQERLGHSKEFISCPKNFEKMVELAKKLSEGFSHVRVDFYNVNGKIYFGEMTFTNGGGYDRIIPSEYDLMLGNMWNNEN